MRLLALGLAALVVAAPRVASAQGSRGQTRPPAESTPAPKAPPTVAPPFNFPMPPLSPSPAGGLTPGGPPAGGPPFRTSDRNLYFPNYPSSYPVYVSPYPTYYDPPPPPDYRERQRTMYQPAESLVGWLRLDVSPSNAEVFIDGGYVGTVDDFQSRTRVMPLDPGTHRLQFRAPYYEPVYVNVRVAANDTVTYRASLVRSTVPPPRRPRSSYRTAPTVPGAAMYVIPGCYAGNLPPREENLPDGCDIAKVRVIREVR